MIGYTTEYGTCLCGDSRDLIKTLEDESIDLVLTSPPFPLSREKYPDQPTQDGYVDWLLGFCNLIKAKLKYTGSLVIEIGLMYEPGRPVKAMYPYEFIIRMSKELGFNLCQDFYFNNKTSLPNVKYCSKEKIRAKSSVSLILWFSKSDRPVANISTVLNPYSDRMMSLLDKPVSSKKVTKRYPSGYTSTSWVNDNGGSIPSNLLSFSNSDGNSKYMRTLRTLDIKPHPCRMNKNLVNFFLKLLCTEDSVVLDIFHGSGTVGSCCEELGLRWLGYEINPEYVASSAIRFADTVEKSRLLFDKIISNCKLSLAGAGSKECNLIDCKNI